MDPTRDYDLDSAGTAPTALDPNGGTTASRRRPKAAFLLVASLVLLALAAGVVVAVGSAGGSQETSNASRVRAREAAVSATTTTSTTTSTTTTTAPPVVEEPAAAPTRGPVVSAREPMPEAAPAPPPSDFVMPTGLVWRITACTWVPDFPNADWGTLSYNWSQEALGGSGFAIIAHESGSGSGYRYPRKLGLAMNAGIPVPPSPIIQVLSTGEVMPLKYFPPLAPDSLRDPVDCAGWPGYIT